MDYDKKSESDILRFAAGLIGHSLAEVASIPQEVINKSNKGQMGLLVEKYFFGLEVNNRPEPDFAEAGLELKVTGLIPKGEDELRAKERLSLTHINFHEIVNETFETSSLVRKCARILILCYKYDKEVSEIDRTFTSDQFIYSLLSQDVEILKNDWLTIKGKIEAGLAHELSETDTIYLKASRKGQGGSKEKPVSQPNSDIKAMKRGFSLTYNYLSHLIALAAGNTEHQLGKLSNRPVTVPEIEAQPVLDSTPMANSETPIQEVLPLNVDESVLVQHQAAAGFAATTENVDLAQLDFKTAAHAFLAQYVGLQTSELLELFPVNSVAKSFRYSLVVKALASKGISKEQLTNAGIKIKTVVLNSQAVPKEHMSFTAFNYEEVCFEDWEDSTFFNEIEQTFLLVVFQESSDGVERLHKVSYWGMPYADRLVAQEVWEETQSRIQSHNFIFPASSESEIAHVRPKAKNSADTITFEGQERPRMAFWLNKQYLAKVISAL